MTASLYPGINLGLRHEKAHREAERKLFGFWVFLMSDLVTFGLFFATYVTMLGGTAGGPGPSDIFHLSSIGVQTACLLASSFTMGLAMVALKYDDARGRLVGWLLVTGLLAAGFLLFEINDFRAAAAIGALPSRSGWLSAYYGLVGLHGFHVSVGLIWLLLMVFRLSSGDLTESVKTRLLRLSLYWHFLDIVWIGIFSVVFLAGVA